MSVNVFADVDISNILPNGILKWDGTKFIAGVVDAGAQANIALFAYAANVANIVVSLANHTTTNLAEGSNLYYTDSRVYANTTALLPQYGGELKAGNISYANATNVVKVYQYYNENTQSLDTVFL